MKTTILNKEVNEEIDWSKPQWVVAKDSNEIVVTSGSSEKHTFIGYCLPCSKYLNGHQSKYFDKKCFQPIPKDGLTIHIQND